MLYLRQLGTKQSRTRHNKRHNNNLRFVQQTIQAKKNLQPTNPPNPHPIIKSLHSVRELKNYHL